MMQAFRSKNWTRLAAAMLWWLSLMCAGQAVAQAQGLPQPLLHLPFDGSLANSGSFPASPVLIAPKGDAYSGTAVFAEGQRGQALSLTGDYAVEIPFGLSREVYPQITVTAWVYSEPNRNKEQVKLVSNGGHLWLNLYGEGLHLNCGSGCFVRQDNTVSDGQWVFAAGILDTASGSMSLSVNGMPMTADMDLSRAPDDRPSVWIGSRRDSESTFGSNTRIDDVRIYGTALANDQISQLYMQGLTGAASIADSGEAETQQAASTSSDPLLETPTGITRPSGLSGPAGMPEQEVEQDVAAAQEAASTSTVAGGGASGAGLAGTLPSTSDIEANIDEQFGAENDALFAPGDSEVARMIREGSHPASDDETRRIIGWRFGDERYQSGITGKRGDNVFDYEFRGDMKYFNRISIAERRNVPCIVAITSERHDRLVADECEGAPFGTLSQGPLDVSLEASDVITAISVCSSENVVSNHRVKGISIRGHRILADGSFSSYHERSDRRPNCVEPWHPITACRAGDAATGLIAHFDTRAGSNELVGLSLYCRAVVPVYE